MKFKYLLTLLPLTALVACNGPQSNEKALYASAFPVYDFVKRIAGDNFEVHNLTPVGMEPHDYEPTTKQIAGITDSRGLFLNGLGFEHWAENLPNKIKEKAYTITDGIDSLKVDGIVDPHMWLDPIRAIDEMKNIKDILSRIDPENATEYSKNFEEEKVKFMDLNSSYTAAVATFTQKKIVVTHAAFGYLCNRYGLEQVFVNGLDPEDEPSAKRMEEIIQEIKDSGVNTVFVEELLPTDIAETIAKETGATIEVLSPIEGLEDENDTADYISAMTENLEKLKKACK